MTPEETAARDAANTAQATVAATARNAAAEAEATRIREAAEANARVIERRAEVIGECRDLAARYNLSADVDTWLTAERRALAPDAILAGFRGHVLTKITDDPRGAAFGLGGDQRVGLSAGETRRFSVVNLVRALETGQTRGAEFEIEACEAADVKAREVGARSPREVQGGGVGYRIPADVLLNWDMRPRTVNGQRTLNTTDDAALVPTEHLAGSFIELLRKQASVMRAGVTLLNGLSGNVDIPKQLTGSAATWVSAEHGDATVTEGTYGVVSLTPKDLAAYIDMSRRMMQQSSPDIEMLARNDILAAMRLGLDAGVLKGTAASGQPRGVRNVVGINKPTGWAGALPTWQEVLAMVSAVEEDEALAGNLKWIGPTAIRSGLMGTPKETGFPTYIMSDAASVLAGYEYIASNQVTAGELNFGNWSEVLVGLWSGLELTIDNSALALKGGRRIIAFQTADVAVRHPESFVWNTIA